MKHSLQKRLLLAMLCVAGALNASAAYNFVVDNIYYEINGTNVSVTSNGDNSYEGDLVIPSTVTYEDVVYTVTKVADWAFNRCTRLTSVTMPPTLKSIGFYSFSQCNGLTSLTIPSGVTSINDGAFSYMRNILEYRVDTANTAYCDVDGVLFSKDKKKLVNYPMGRQDTAYTIPDGVTSIIRMNNPYLKHVDFPEGLKRIEGWTFQDDESLVSVLLPQSVSYLGPQSFAGCDSLETVVFGSGLTYMHQNIFAINETLKSITCHAPTPPSVSNMTFYNFRFNITTLFVPKSSLELYKNHQYWKDFIHMQGISVGTGDVNYNGAIDLGDVVMIIDKLLEGKDIEVVADVNGDGVVNISDVVAIIDVLLGNDLPNPGEGNLSNGLFGLAEDASPDMEGTATSDHVFVRNSDCNMNNIVFNRGAQQTVWLWLDDEAIYHNQAIQALTPIGCDGEGSLYNEITYSGLQLDLYLPACIEPAVDGQGKIVYHRGDRIPNSSIVEIEPYENPDDTIDGLPYKKYLLKIYSTQEYGSHLSSTSPEEYYNHGALKKNDAPLIGLDLQMTATSALYAEYDNLIIGNTSFSVSEANLAGWDANSSHFFFGTGGNNETQVFNSFNRVRIFNKP
ncbi:MAG: leucine-rich repeat protein [Muribaculaceae bacterium]|nr:leucine-rich repeat protein [Muribaculaceae bacterium]